MMKFSTSNQGFPLVGFQAKQANSPHFALNVSASTTTANTALRRLKASIFYKVLSGYLFVLCFGMALPSAKGQTVYYPDHNNFKLSTLPDGSASFVQLISRFEKILDTVCNFPANRSKGGLFSITNPLPNSTNNVLITESMKNIVSDIPSYYIAQAGVPFKFRLSGNASEFYVKAYSGSENEPTTTKFFESPYHGQDITITFKAGATKAWIVLELIPGLDVGSGAFYLTMPFVVTGAKDANIPVQGTLTTPKKPFMVIHAPSGDNSTSSYTKTGRNCRSFEQTQTTANSSTGNLDVKVGVQGAVGVIVTLKKKSRRLGLRHRPSLCR